MRPESPWRRWVERALLAIGIACLGWSGGRSLTAMWYQQEQRQALERERRQLASEAQTSPETIPPGGLIGSLDIPRLHLSAVVAEGDNDATLNIAVGHLPDT